MITDLTSVSTFGWYSDEEYDVDLLTSISTFGWYGATLKDLIDGFPTVDFGLIIDRLHEIGFEIEEIHEIENLSIQMLEEIGNFEITQLINFNLKR